MKGGIGGRIGLATALVADPWTVGRGGRVVGAGEATAGELRDSRTVQRRLLRYYSALARRGRKVKNASNFSIVSATGDKHQR